MRSSSSSHRARAASGSLCVLALLALPATASVDTVDAYPGVGSISAALTTLNGPGPHTIFLKQSTTAGVANRFVETATLDIGSREILIVGLGSDAVWQMDETSLDANLARVAAGGELTLSGVYMDGSVAGDLGDEVTLELCDFGVGRRGVSVEAGGSLVVEDGSLFRCFFADHGSAIDSSGGSVEIYDSAFDLSLALDYGAHVAVSNATTFVSSNTKYEYGGVVSGSGGALHVVQTTTQLVDNEFYYNESIISGGAVYIDNCSPDDCTKDLEVWGNTFQGNQAVAFIEYVVVGGGVDTGNNDNNELFGLNTVQGEGGALYADSSDTDLWNNLFCGNISDVGGAVHFPDPTIANIENNVFADNVAFHYGGGLFMMGQAGMTTPHIVNNTFLANEAGRIPNPPEVFVYGGGGHMFLDGTLATIRNNILAEAIFGAGVGGVADETRNWDLGEPFDIEYNILFENCEIEACDATQNFSGDLDSQALSPTNVDADPLPVYLGEGDYDCYPDAFYPEWTSVAVNKGDPAILDIHDLPNMPSDIGAYGGPRADVEDEDADDYADIYDCDDFNADIHPDAIELCDLIDNNCDGQVDEGWVNSWWIDADGDGQGNPALEADFIGCAQPTGMVDNNTDCMDVADPAHPTVTPSAVFEGATEVCDGADNDCDTVADEEIPYYLYYFDGDEDEFGTIYDSFTPDNMPTIINVCDPVAPDGYTSITGDCDDSTAAVRPGEIEICDGGLDNDCDTSTDENVVSGQAWYSDGDGDGYGLESTMVNNCDQPPASVNVGGDCDDTNGAISPAATELCNSLDDDCDASVDDNPPGGGDPDASELDERGYTFYPDADADLQGDPDGVITTCDPTAPDGYFTEGELEGIEDCDDGDETVQKCKSECGCNATPTPSSMGMLVLAVLGLVRRRRS